MEQNFNKSKVKSMYKNKWEISEVYTERIEISRKTGEQGRQVNKMN